jgi:hypothetical protein
LSSLLHMSPCVTFLNDCQSLPVMIIGSQCLNFCSISSCSMTIYSTNLSAASTPHFHNLQLESADSRSRRKWHKELLVVSVCLYIITIYLLLLEALSSEVHRFDNIEHDHSTSVLWWIHEDNMGSNDGVGG